MIPNASEVTVRGTPRVSVTGQQSWSVVLALLPACRSSHGLSREAAKAFPASKIIETKAANRTIQKEVQGEQCQGKDIAR